MACRDCVVAEKCNICNQPAPVQRSPRTKDDLRAAAIADPPWALRRELESFAITLLFALGEFLHAVTSKDSEYLARCVRNCYLFEELRAHAKWVQGNIHEAYQNEVAYFDRPYAQMVSVLEMIRVMSTGNFEALDRLIRGNSPPACLRQEAR